ncbi:hypothetical protein NQ315_012718 [Exocentrus adspersus]|uniref:Alpha-amylase n=1 Tax=Exocentrus adspersus TaxID=1586481 RepID=A0AAV8VTH1_9CUCU|nr:hypothetical protein NQ315_012718 [Exocentrus adspersus]
METVADTAKMFPKTFFLSPVLFTVTLCQFDPHFFGNRTTFVHLFEWKWLDVAEECERFLSQKAYGGVQISPPNENLVIPNRPWIYVDAVINHMTASDGVGTAGSRADYKNKAFPAVPYTKDDFHGDCALNNYQDSNNVRNCQLVGLSDLDHSREHVRQKIIEYMNHLVDLGVAGFRIDAAKHMWPEDLKKILAGLKNLNTAHGFATNSKPFVFQEVTDSGTDQIKDYADIAAVTEFKYSNSITNVFQGNDKLTYLDSWGPKWSFLVHGTPVVFVDNHDTQREQGKLTYKDSKRYKMATAFMLAHPYGIPKVMSSFFFNNKDQGPPQDASGNLVSPTINPDDTCGSGYVCEHRWRQIYSMVEFRNLVKGTEVTNWWSNGDQQIAFCRGNKGFVAFTNWGDLKKDLQTCLAPGRYCDIISGSLKDGRCTGKQVEVKENGFGFISLSAGEYDGVLAIHVNSKSL